MHYKYKSSLLGKKSTCNSQVVLGAPDRVNIPCLMHDTRLCQ